MSLSKSAQSELHSAHIYDQQWAQLDDFIKYNPGARHRRRLMISLLRGLKFNSVLDVGCGPGKGLMALNRSFPHLEKLWGIDFAPEVVQSNRISHERFGFSHLDITEGALEQRFDLIVCSEVIEHLEAREEAFLNLSKMLNPGGHLLITCPMGKVYATEVNWGHISHPNRGDIKRLGSQVGLSEVRCIEWGFPAYRVLKWAVNVDPEWSLRKFGSGPYGQLKKRLNDLLYLATFANLPLPGRGCQLLVLLKKQD